MVNALAVVTFDAVNGANRLIHSDGFDKLRVLIQDGFKSKSVLASFFSREY